MDSFDLDSLREALEPFGKLVALNTSGSNKLNIYIGTGFVNTTKNIEEMFLIIEEYTKPLYKTVLQCSVLPTSFCLVLKK